MHIQVVSMRKHMCVGLVVCQCRRFKWGITKARVTEFAAWNTTLRAIHYISHWSINFKESYTHSKRWQVACALHRTSDRTEIFHGKFVQPLFQLKYEGIILATAFYLSLKIVDQTSGVRKHIPYQHFWRASGFVKDGSRFFSRASGWPERWGEGEEAVEVKTARYKTPW